MSLYRDEGVVLRTSKLGEADRIITILTRGHGKIRAVAKGVRRTKSRFGARLEPFMRVDVLIAEGRSLDVVSQAEAVAAYGAPIAADYAAYEAANVIVETIDKIASTEHEQLPNQYRLLIGALNALAKQSHAPQAIGDSYVMRALALAGWDAAIGHLRGMRQGGAGVPVHRVRRRDVRSRPHYRCAPYRTVRVKPVRCTDSWRLVGA